MYCFVRVFIYYITTMIDNYHIDFQLLLPRPLLLRYDVLPFLLLYAGLLYVLFTFPDEGNTYIYLRLTFVAVAFLNCLTAIFGHWSKKVQGQTQYWQLKGDLQDNLDRASHVFVREKVPGYADSYGVCDLYLQELEAAHTYPPKLYFFYFQQRKFYYNPQTNSFSRLKPPTAIPISDVLCQYPKLCPEPYDDNILQIPIRPFGEIFKDQIVDPFQFFQLFSVLLWMLDENGGYSLFILIMLVFSAYMISVQRIKTLVGFRSMTLAPHEVRVWRKGKWEIISSYDLKPGEIMLVEAGYQHKKSPYKMMTDEEYLSKNIPFGAKMPSNLSRPPTSKSSENSSYRTVPADILLLSGTCIANESILTGEAVPQVKQCITSKNLPEQFIPHQYKHNILFCGTEVLQIGQNANQGEASQLIKDVDVTESRGCLGLVLTTGFDTSKGKLIRKVVANTESLRLEEKDGLWIILFLLICSLITSAYVLDQGMQNEERSKEKLFLRCILIITTVVPPQLPMILTLTVNNSILELQKKKIFVSEPKKIPIGGKIDTIAFDKTGTLTEDKFIFEGIVDHCSDFRSIKKLSNCTHENCVILSGCHSLISIDKELSGDPIELIFFNETNWAYSSKNKQARKGLERVMIRRVYPFRSELKRMSALVEHIPENGGIKNKVLVKGAPEAIQLLLKQVPENYQKAYQHYTKQGYRLLALASKVLSMEEINSMKKETQREEMQKNLAFAGFFICSSPLKEDTLKNIKHLQKANYKLKIITGDNILTAIKVGVMLNMGNQPYILEYIDDKLILQHQMERKEINNPKQVSQILSNNDLVCTSTAKSISEEYYPFISIFARTSPQDKEKIVKKIKQHSKSEGGGILYAGDGTNDMGGLRVADVGVAVIGTTTITEQERKEDEFKEEEARFKEKIREVQMDPRTTFGKKMEQMKKLNQEFMLKKKENMFQPDDEAKAGDACFAAPFTSKHSNSIKCVLIILRQAIATIVTTIQTYKILAISSMIQAYSLAEMNLTNLKYSQTQTLVIGILASINLYYFSNAKPLNRISEIRAPHTIFSIWFGISFFGQILIFLFCNYYALNWIGLKYMLDEDKNISADAQFKQSFVNTVIFLFSLISQSTVFISNHGGEPHMESLLKNTRQFKFLIIPLLFCFVMTANLIPDFSSWFDLKFDGIPYEANLQMLVVFGFMVLSTYLLERFCRFGQFKKFVGWF